MNTDFTVRTKRLTLVPMCMKYFDTACDYAMSAENAKLMVFLPKTDREEVKSFILEAEKQWKLEQPDICEFALLLGDKHIGGLTMYFEGDYTRGELGWIIHRDYWGKGYAVEAAQGLIDFFAKKMKLRRFIAHCDAENAASVRVMEKLGMSYVETHGGRYNRSTVGERQEKLYEIRPDGGNNNG